MICIVDDDPDVRSATVDLLESLGHSAVAFESAESFLDSNYACANGCLILDCNLPGLSGLELQDQLQANACPLVIIILTAFPNRTDEKRARRAGAVSYLTKPYAEAELIAAIEKALSS